MLRNYMEKEGIELLPKMVPSVEREVCFARAVPALFGPFCLAPGLAATTATIVKCHPYTPTKQACKEHSFQTAREVWQGSLFP